MQRQRSLKAVLGRDRSRKSDFFSDTHSYVHTKRSPCKLFSFNNKIRVVGPLKTANFSRDNSSPRTALSVNFAINASRVNLDFYTRVNTNLIIYTDDGLAVWFSGFLVEALYDNGQSA